MRKLFNIACVLLVYLAGLIAARYLLQPGNPVVTPDVAKWLWGLGVLLTGNLGTFLWKVHDAKKAEGLTAIQRERVRRVARLISVRIYLLTVIVFVASVGGFLSTFVKDQDTSIFLAQITLGAMLSSAAIWLVWMILAQQDLQRFEDRAREELALQKAAQELAKRLSGGVSS